jgi:DNA-binding NarL/FixJ family response regulator
MARPVTALVIDDEPHVRVLLGAILKQIGVRTVWEAADGIAGAALAAAQKPEVILLDINLPEVNGLEVLATLKAQAPAIPVVIVSAQSTVRTLEKAKALGADGFIVKYVAKSEISDLLSRELDRIGGGVSEPAGETGAS